MMDIESYFKEAKKAPDSGGKTQLLKHLKGERLTYAQAVKANCCFCMGYYHDGRVDCKMPHCPLYPYMPYRKKEDKPKQKATQQQLDALQKARKVKSNFHEQLKI